MTKVRNVERFTLAVELSVILSSSRNAIAVCRGYRHYPRGISRRIEQAGFANHFIKREVPAMSGKQFERFAA
jgi:hypothetical protein